MEIKIWINAFKKKISQYTNYCDYGENNRVIFVKNGIERKKIFMPKGLKIVFAGNNNVARIDETLRFENMYIEFEGNNAEFSVKKSKWQYRDVTFFLDDNASIILGENVQLKSKGAKLIANCYYKDRVKIEIGNNVLIGQNALIRTSDGHTLINAETGESLNPAQDVIIEDNVWIGANCTLLKGTRIPKGCVVGACSMLNKYFDTENTIIAGSPAKVIKHNVTWNAKGYGTYTRAYDKKLKKGN